MGILKGEIWKYEYSFNRDVACVDGVARAYQFYRKNTFHPRSGVGRRADDAYADGGKGRSGRRDRSVLSSCRKRGSGVGRNDRASECRGSSCDKPSQLQWVQHLPNLPKLLNVQ